MGVETYHCQHRRHRSHQVRSRCVRHRNEEARCCTRCSLLCSWIYRRHSSSHRRRLQGYAKSADTSHEDNRWRSEELHAETQHLLLNNAVPTFRRVWVSAWFLKSTVGIAVRVPGAIQLSIITFLGTDNKSASSIQTRK